MSETHRYVVTRIWVVEARDTHEAIAKAAPGEQKEIHIHRADQGHQREAELIDRVAVLERQARQGPDPRLWAGDAHDPH